VPHPKVSQRIAEADIAVHLLREEEIRQALAELFRKQGLIVEPSCIVTTAFVAAHGDQLEEPICVVLTGENITREDFWKLIAPDSTAKDS
jgi:threonine dehydratase